MKHFCYGLNDFSDSSKEIDSFKEAKDHKQTVKHSEKPITHTPTTKAQNGRQSRLPIAPSPIPSSIHYCKCSISSLPFPF